MRKESCPSISSRSAVSYRMPAMALLSIAIKIKQVGAGGEARAIEMVWLLARTRAGCPRDKPAGRRRYSERSLRRLGDVGGLRPLLSLCDFELDLIALLKTLVAFRGDRAVVHEHVSAAIVASDKTVALGVVKPFHGTFQAFHVRPLGHVLLRCEAVPCN